MIKKVLLSLFVIATFVIYSLHQRGESSNVLPVVANTTNSTSSSTTTTTPALTTPSTSSTATPAQYKDGSYTGSSGDAFYGYIKVKVTISGGKITDVVFLDHPSDRQTSIEINSQAMPILKQQAIAAQSANVDGVSGATDTSMAFIQSLSDALNQAKA